MLANVLYDLEFAEVKGTGIRTMRRLLKEAGLEAPVFLNSVVDNQFKSIYLLHQLMGGGTVGMVRSVRYPVP